MVQTQSVVAVSRPRRYRAVNTASKLKTTGTSETLPLDPDGKPRVFNGTYAMDAYEYQSGEPPAL
ncbi:MAG: hypothetical protein JXA30_02365 [Deltaproteobacteria bacterium]|nr:hypothetical protein [Deltaproteobacteria bacterium]